MDTDKMVLVGFVFTVVFVAGGLTTCSMQRNQNQTQLKSECINSGSAILTDGNGSFHCVKIQPSK
jgi:hypothetical protein